MGSGIQIRSVSLVTLIAWLYTISYENLDRRSLLRGCCIK